MSTWTQGPKHQGEPHPVAIRSLSKQADRRDGFGPLGSTIGWTVIPLGNPSNLVELLTTKSFPKQTLIRHQALSRLIL